ncbi:twin-arginine translocation pathway signal [Leptolyngbya boryana NIES-2135]|jgi:nitrate/nitrite transport system substrate-binding protein|uniref:Twin-arginine translocation pathway signal n=1 Tax=Leptolyngbya boryana NIES-2135 TaxID=1973484 RepID=A0A1Z4JIK6_LEPBY|nr:MULTISPECIES: CmpA/NrtA family ABC transporter substrate-binding protein [Leptolyngbya]BAY56574.1 twin-arginine translocation pathway signal [Leptolyngbya boryana NIES-2135]MBD2369879.1 ABC transporter substrate-binding protein [Leptolyngbya sp. FACHB-161]MBD2376176.1 ABC transporter substrate-binding protein [Leptolyngbya sp. FACHB-238]MBD2400451.1 ABC transporter substrate-binding protein [Leptolyngbya sp. FACHB-239]MBD2406993.1 ABC transporter substrate-binding protein [Leptolyngbya sp. 
MRNWTRRAFLIGAGTSTVAASLPSCAINASRAPQGLSEAAMSVTPVIQSSELEKPNLTLGYVPVNDCAPFAIAWEKGFFRKYGLNVQLSREASWATSRDGLIFGRLDAAPVVAGAVTNARVGAEGARHAPMCAGMTIHHHGNAMTMNRAMWESGLRPWSAYNGNLDTFGQDFRQYFDNLPSEQRVWAVVLSSSIYEYFVRYVAAAAGVNPLKEFRVIIVPPPQMVTNVRIGAMQGYMVAEPWNTRAISGNEGIGFTFAQGREIWNGHPDRLLAVMQSFIDENPKTYRALLKAMIEACRYCDQNREEVAQIISARSYTGANVKFTRPAIVGDYNYGGFDGKNRTVKSDSTTMFFDMPKDVPHVKDEHSTFMWQSRSLWLMTQAARWGQIKEIPKDADQIAAKSWRTDIYREVAAELGIACPTEDYKVEPSAAFIDKKAFDPSDPVGYLNSFEIRASQATKVYFS